MMKAAGVADPCWAFVSADKNAGSYWTSCLLGSVPGEATKREREYFARGFFCRLEQQGWLRMPELDTKRGQAWENNHGVVYWFGWERECAACLRESGGHHCHGCQLIARAEEEGEA